MRRALALAIAALAAILGLSGALSGHASAQTALVTDYAKVVAS